MKPKLKQKGFTLIELLVVIAIIGLLASVVLVALNGARIKARDTRRIADLKQIQTALALYYDANGNVYPCAGSSWVYSTDVSPTPWQSSCLGLALIPKYLAKLPVDPTNNAAAPWTGNLSYAFAATLNGQDYDLVTTLEDSSNPLRCGTKNWLYHIGGNVPWCTGVGAPGVASTYVDH